MKKITVTIPSYRQPQLLDRALCALANQTIQDFKVLILDDASGVDFGPILKNYLSLDIQVIANEKNLGAMKNMLKSIVFATDTPFLLSHHEDDFLKNNYLECALEILEKNPAISFVATTPDWIAKDAAYIKNRIHNASFTTFTAAQFVHEVLAGMPIMFGSVVYRRSHLIDDWKLETYATFCDRYFLGEILHSHRTLGALIKEPGIFVRDHTLDKEDNRGNGTTEDHAIALYTFYKRMLHGHYPKAIVQKLTTNGLLLTFSNFSARSSLRNFYQKQKKEKLISFTSLSRVGVFALLTLPFSRETKQKIIQSSREFLKR